MANLARTTTEEGAKSIRHALSMLNEAAQESSQEIRSMVSTDYRKLKGILSDAKPEVGGALKELRDASVDTVRHAGEKIVETSKEAVRTVDQSAHKNPWAFIGGTALTAGILGFFMGRRMNSKS